jgi:hypothetical protein
MATDPSVAEMPSSIAMAKTSPASGTPRDKARTITKREWTGYESGDESDDRPFAVNVRLAVNCPQKQCDSNRSDQAAADVFEDIGSTRAGDRARKELRARQGQEYGRGNVCH